MACGSALFDRGKFAVLLGEHGRVHDGVQPRQVVAGSANTMAPSFGRSTRPSGSENVAAKFAHHIIVCGAAGLDHLVRDLVGFEHVAAEFAKHRGHRAFAGGDSAGQADAQHQGLAARRAARVPCERDPRRRRAAFTVLLISMAMVSGPTPPGTGVIAPATSATSG